MAGAVDDGPGAGWLYADLLLVLALLGLAGLLTRVGNDVDSDPDAAIEGAVTTTTVSWSATVPSTAVPVTIETGSNAIGLDRKWIDVPWKLSDGAETFRKLLIAEMGCLADEIEGRSPGFAMVFNYSDSSATSQKARDELLKMDEFAGLRPSENPSDQFVLAYKDEDSDVRPSACVEGPSYSLNSMNGYVRVFFITAPGQ